jgi:hypothetical protein
MKKAIQRPIQPFRYLPKQDVMRRYGWKSTLSVDRAWKEYGTLPPPTYIGRKPLWDEQELDERDAHARESSVVASPERKKAMTLILKRARDAKRQSRSEASA